MQKFNRHQKLIGLSMLVVLVLSIVTLTSRPDFVYRQENIDFAAQQRAFEEHLAQLRLQYEQFIAEETDLEASREILQTLVVEEEVRAMAETELDINQKIEVPVISDSAIKTKKDSSKAAVTEYFNNHFNSKKGLTDTLATTSLNVYRSVTPIVKIGEAKTTADSFTEELYKVNVPEPVTGYHKAVIGAYESYKRLLATAERYATGEDLRPWPSIYREWVIANTHARTMQSELNALEQQYAISESYAVAYGLTQDEAHSLLASAGIIKTAEAFSLFGITFNVEVGNILQEIRNAIASALSAFFSRLLTNMLAKIEQNFKISNFLYYTDALVAGQYAPDYLEKYVTNPVDQEIIKRFLPQSNCGVLDEQKLRPLLDQRAKEYIGIDLTQPLDVNRADFYTIVNRAGHLSSSIEGQSLKGYAKAQELLTVVNNVINNELQSEGKKAGRSKPNQADFDYDQDGIDDNTGRPVGVPADEPADFDLDGDGTDDITGEPLDRETVKSDALIQFSVGSLQAASTAQFVGAVSMGANNAEITFVISNIVKTVITTFLNNFIFRKAQFVFEEQDRRACIAGVTKVRQIVPANIPSSAPDVIDEDFIKQCRQNPQGCIAQFDNLDLDPTLPPPPAPESNNFKMDKRTYIVGEVPRFEIINAAPNSKISWEIKHEQDDPILITYEDQHTDENGNWSSPHDRGFECQELGRTTRTAIVAGQRYNYTYTVTDPTNSCGS